MRRELKGFEDIKINFLRFDEIWYWNINLIELFIEYKWIFIYGSVGFVR